MARSAPEPAPADARERSAQGRGRRRFRWLAAGLAAVFLGVIVVGLATAPPRPADRVDALASRLRCPVCQGESIADSPSQTAREMRDQIAELVAAGRSDVEVVDHYVARYGRWVRLDPPVAADTVALWVLPLALLVGGAVVVGMRRRQPGPTVELSAAERAELARRVARTRQRHEP